MWLFWLASGAVRNSSPVVCCGRWSAVGFRARSHRRATPHRDRQQDVYRESGRRDKVVRSHSWRNDQCTRSHFWTSCQCLPCLQFTFELFCLWAIFSSTAGWSQRAYSMADWLSGCLCVIKLILKSLLLLQFLSDSYKTWQTWSVSIGKKAVEQIF